MYMYSPVMLPCVCLSGFVDGPRLEAGQGMCIRTRLGIAMSVWHMDTLCTNVLL